MELTVQQQIEEHLLAGVLRLEHVWDEVADIVKPADFSVNEHNLLWHLITVADSEGASLDLLSVRHRADSTLAGKTIPTKLWDRLQTLVPTEKSMSEYARAVAEHGLRTRLIRCGQEMVELGADRGNPVTDLVSEAEQRLLILSADGNPGHKPVGTTTREVLKQLPQPSVSVPTGFKTFDNWAGGGWKPGQMIVLAARPGGGKSSLALQTAQHVAATGHTVLFESYEMGADELCLRLLAAATNTAPTVLQKIAQAGAINPKLEKLLTDAADRLDNLPLLIDDNPPVDVYRLRSSLRRQTRRNPVGLIVVDYLQLLAGRRLENRNQEVGEITRTLKLAAKEMNLPILVLSQLNRQVEHRGDRRPALSDLRDSGSIEQDADIVLFLTNTTDTSNKKQPELIVAKHRNGPCGIIKLDYRPDRFEFRDRGIRHPKGQIPDNEERAPF